MQPNNDLLQAVWNQNTAATLPSLGLNLLLAAVLGFALGQVFIRFGRSFSNRRRLARQFLLLTLTTTLVISIVKSSLALSLGLVGALSIVRFRTAIKEPEELAYLFFAISIGLGLGANQTVLTFAAFALIVVILTVQHFLHRTPDQPSLFVTVHAPSDAALSLAAVTDALHHCGIHATLHRFDQSASALEASFHAAPVEAARMQQLSERLRKLHEQAHVTFVAERLGTE